MSEKKTSETALKKKPGRPRKRPIKPESIKKGVLTDPVTKDNIIELLYDKPVNFKKICSYWKSLNADRITFVFTPEKLYLYTRDHNENNDVQFIFDGSKMSSYYCGEERRISINFNNLELILQKLDKSYESISFVVTNNDRNKLLYIILKNEENIPEYFDMDVIMDFKDPIQYDIFDQRHTLDYQMEFRLKGKYFKKAISDTKHFEKQWTIEKDGSEGKLIFSYKSDNGQVRAKVVPESLKDINLVSRIKPQEIFSVSVFTNNIKPTSSNQLADYINIRASQSKPLWVWAQIDENAIIVNILIQIVDYRSLDKSDKGKRDDKGLNRGIDRTALDEKNNDSDTD
jgi:hypothetical protein